MYDWPEVRWAHDALWSAIASRLRASGIAAPEKLDRTRRSDDLWRDPSLVLSQTCGWPFSTRLIGKVRLVTTPTYDVDGCEGPRYSTMIVARRGEGISLRDFAERRFAFNSDDSLSGYVAFRAALREASLNADAATWIETGSHRDSLRAVAERTADLASIDAVCFALAKDYEADAVAKLAVVAQTPLRPGLPFLTANRSEAEVDLIRSAVEAAVADPAIKDACGTLHLSGVAVVAEAEYAKLASP